MDIALPSAASTAAFVAVLVAVWGAVIAGVAWARSGRAAAAVAVGTLAWFSLLSLVPGLARSVAQPVPLLLLFFFASNGAGLLFALSPVGRWLAGLPVWALVAFQSFRLPLELVLHAWGEQGFIPMTMTWEGSNLDVVAGVGAVLIAPLAFRWPAAAWVINVVGFALLLNVMRVAMLSSPVPFGWGLEEPLLIAFLWPYALIVPVCVAGALAGHVVLTRAQLTSR